MFPQMDVSPASLLLRPRPKQQLTILRSAHMTWRFMSAQSIYFVSLGCPKNQVDTEVMLGQVKAAGHELATDPAEADVLVVNTCGFIDAAKEESIDTILEMAQFKKQRAHKLVVTGCLAQRYSSELAKDIPEIDHILGSGDFSQLAASIGLPVQVRGKSPGKRKLPMATVAVSTTPTFIYDHHAPRIRTGPAHSAYVKIAEGCDRPCSFCIIPQLRGPQRSRSVDDIVTEANNLAAAGVKEINLIAQDLTRYGKDRGAAKDTPGLAALLRALGDVQIPWVRLHYTYPSAFDDELIDVIAKSPNVVPYIDVPLQHISDAMLKRMRRGHTSRVTRALVDTLSERVANVVLRTTFIVGHPGETDADFRELCDFLESAKFDRAGAFTYSTEPGTHSATLDELVASDVALARQQELMAIQAKVSRAKNESLVGRTLDVLIDGVSSESEYLLEGRWYGQAPGIDGMVYVADGVVKSGTIAKVRVTQASDYDLAASLELDA